MVVFDRMFALKLVPSPSNPGTEKVRTILCAGAEAHPDSVLAMDFDRLSGAGSL